MKTYVLGCIALFLLSIGYLCSTQRSVSAVADYNRTDTLKNQIIVDTLYIFNPLTQEKSMKIETKAATTADLANHEKERLDLRYWKKRVFEVRDTVKLFDPKTFTETITITTHHLNCKDYAEWVWKDN